MKIFFYLMRYDLLIYSTSELNYTFPNLFTFLGRSCASAKAKNSENGNTTPLKLFTKNVILKFLISMFTFQMHSKSNLSPKACKTCAISTKFNFIGFVES